MNNHPLSLPIQPQSLLWKTTTIDWKKYTINLLKAGAMFTVGKYDSAFKEVIGMLEAFGLKTDPSDIAYQLLSKSLVEVTQTLIEENRVRLRFDGEELYSILKSTEYTNFEKSIKGLFETDEFVFSNDTLKNPSSIPLVATFQEHFEQFLILLKVPSQEASNITKRVPDYFLFALHNEWRKNAARYEPLLQQIQTPFTNSIEQVLQWKAYYAYLQQEVNKPIFDESFSLKDVFIDLRAAIQPERNRNRSREYIYKSKRKVVQLKEQIYTWLDTGKHHIQIIQGGPGSGKSSFAKILAAEVAGKDSYRVLFFPLSKFTKIFL